MSYDAHMMCKYNLPYPLKFSIFTTALYPCVLVSLTDHCVDESSPAAPVHSAYGLESWSVRGATAPTRAGRSSQVSWRQPSFASAETRESVQQCTPTCSLHELLWW